MKFISHEYDKETKETWCFVQHLGLEFSGYSKPAQDEIHPSELFGGRLAEKRAILNALNYEKELRFTEYLTISNFIKSCCNTKKFDKESQSAKVMFHQLNVAKKRYKKVKVKIDFVKASINYMIEERERYFKERAKKINKNYMIEKRENFKKRGQKRLIFK